MRNALSRQERQEALQHAVASLELAMALYGFNQPIGHGKSSAHFARNRDFLRYPNLHMGW